MVHNSVMDYDRNTQSIGLYAPMARKQNVIIEITYQISMARKLYTIAI